MRGTWGQDCNSVADDLLCIHKGALGFHPITEQARGNQVAVLLECYRAMDVLYIEVLLYPLLYGQLKVVLTRRKAACICDGDPFGLIKAFCVSLVRNKGYRI